MQIYLCQWEIVKDREMLTPMVARLFYPNYSPILVASGGGDTPYTTVKLQAELQGTLPQSTVSNSKFSCNSSDSIIYDTGCCSGLTGEASRRSKNLKWTEAIA